MAAPVLIPTDDFDPFDPQRTVDLGDVGLDNHCLSVTIDSSGVEHFAVLQYGIGSVTTCRRTGKPLRHTRFRAGLSTSRCR